MKPVVERKLRKLLAKEMAENRDRLIALSHKLAATQPDIAVMP